MQYTHVMKPSDIYGERAYEAIKASTFFDLLGFHPPRKGQKFFDSDGLVSSAHFDWIGPLPRLIILEKVARPKVFTLEQVWE